MILQFIFKLTIEQRKKCVNLQYIKLTILKFFFCLFFSTINYSAELPLAQGIKFEWTHVYIKRTHSTKMSSVISLFEVLKNIYNCEPKKVHWNQRLFTFVLVRNIFGRFVWHTVYVEQIFFILLIWKVVTWVFFFCIFEKHVIMNI